MTPIGFRPLTRDWEGPVMRDTVAASGRDSPIGVPEIVSATKDWSLMGTRRLVFRNPDRGLAAAQTIVLLRPGRDVTLFSLPLEVSRREGARAVREALRALGRWKNDASGTREGLSLTIAVNMVAPQRLQLVEHRVRYRRKKFGAGEGLTSSRKPRVTSERVIELGAVDHGRTRPAPDRRS